MFRPLPDRWGPPCHVGHRHVHRRCRLRVPCTQIRTQKGATKSFRLPLDIRVSGAIISKVAHRDFLKSSAPATCVVTRAALGDVVSDPPRSLRT